MAEIHLDLTQWMANRMKTSRWRNRSWATNSRTTRYHSLMNKPYFVCAEWDSDAQVWIASSDDVPGLVTEAATIEALDAKLQTMVPELLEANGCLPSGETIQVGLFARRFSIANLAHT